MSMTPKERCPQCGSELREVRYDPNSMLNREQFDSVKAGDFYCVNCRGDRARTGYKYFWRRELTQPEPAPGAQITADFMAEAFAQMLHEAYERLAPQFNYETRPESAKPWVQIPENNRRLMIAACGEVLRRFVLKDAPSAQPEQPTDEQRAREVARAYPHLIPHIAALAATIRQEERRETAQRVCNNVRKHFYPRSDHRYFGTQIAEWLDEAGKAEGA